MGRGQRSGKRRRNSQSRGADHRDFAVTPGLASRPLHSVVAVVVVHAEWNALSLGPAGTTRVLNHKGVSARRIRDSLITARSRNLVLAAAVLAIRSALEDHRPGALPFR